MNRFMIRPTMAFLLISSINFAVYAADNTIQIPPDHLRNLGVTLSKPKAVSQIPLLSAPATVVVPPAQEFIISAAQAGAIDRMNAAIGDKVAKGQVLARLDSPELLTLQREYLKALSALQLASAGYRRDKTLLDEGVIAERRWQETRIQYQSLQSEANEQKQLLEMAGMTVGEVKQLAKSHRLTRQLNVRAPVDGVVMERLAVAGTRIDMMTPIYRLANLDELWLEIAIPQERLRDIKIGDRVLIENSEAEAKITLLGQNVNPENQTIVARALIRSNGKQSLRPGQRLNARIIQSGNKAVFKVPDSAIVRNEGNAFIFIRSDQGFSVVPVTVVGKQDKASVISGELTGNEQIAVTGTAVLKANWLGLGSDE